MAKKYVQKDRFEENRKRSQDTSKMKPVNRAARRAIASNKATKPTNKKWRCV